MNIRDECVCHYVESIPFTQRVPMCRSFTTSILHPVGQSTVSGTRTGVTIRRRGKGNRTKGFGFQEWVRLVYDWSSTDQSHFVILSVFLFLHFNDRSSLSLYFCLPRPWFIPKLLLHSFPWSRFPNTTLMPWLSSKYLSRHPRGPCVWIIPSNPRLPF